MGGSEIIATLRIAAMISITWTCGRGGINTFNALASVVFLLTHESGISYDSLQLANQSTSQLVHLSWIKFPADDNVRKWWIDFVKRSY